MMERAGPVTFSEALALSREFSGDEAVKFYSDRIGDFFLSSKQETAGIPRAKVRSRLIIPPQYYLDRGFSKEVLDEFDVGLCNKPNMEMSDRVVFPVYENTGKYMVGCVGRTIVDSAKKWKVQKGFSCSNYLFNYWRAIEWICRYGKAVLVEGQGEVMRFWEAGIYNVVGCFGAKLSLPQEILLQKTGVADIVTAFDADEAGEKARINTEQSLSRLFRVSHKVPNSKDFGEVPLEDLKSLKKEFS
jgi:hypothetical protein